MCRTGTDQCAHAVRDGAYYSVCGTLYFCIRKVVVGIHLLRFGLFQRGFGHEKRIAGCGEVIFRNDLFTMKCLLAFVGQPGGLYLCFGRMDIGNSCPQGCLVRNLVYNKQPFTPTYLLPFFHAYLLYRPGHLRIDFNVLPSLYGCGIRFGQRHFSFSYGHDRIIDFFLLRFRLVTGSK